MLELTPDNALAYLREAQLLAADVPARVEPLAWGVSNLVLRVFPAQGEDFVVKQSRAQLRTRDPWFSRLDRIWREVGVMQLLEPLLPRGAMPRILFEDRSNYLFAMEAAPARHLVWKEMLLAGRTDDSIAERLGTLLGTIHRETAFDDELHRIWGDTEVFIQLRVDPFYRRVADLEPAIDPPVQAMIEEMFATPICMVHADFSPKNVLVTDGDLTLVDFETAHYGDPAFDLGFFLSHLLLKSVLHADRFAAFAQLTSAFWTSYLHELRPVAETGPFSTPDLTRRTVTHLAACMWARIDGTSKIDYLSQDAQQQSVRHFCRRLLLEPPATWPEVLTVLQARLTAAR